MEFKDTKKEERLYAKMVMVYRCLHMSRRSSGAAIEPETTLPTKQPIPNAGFSHLVLVAGMPESLAHCAYEGKEIDMVLVHGWFVKIYQHTNNQTNKQRSEQIGQRVNHEARNKQCLSKLTDKQNKLVYKTLTNNRTIKLIACDAVKKGRLITCT